jgi:hypothetical protein
MQPMETHVIPAEQWLAHFDKFSREHVGWPISIEVLDEANGPQKTAAGLPFLGISFDTGGTRPSSVEISAGGGSAPHVAHVIDLPMRIAEAEDPNGNIDLRIEPADGAVTLVHLQAPMH